MWWLLLAALFISPVSANEAYRCNICKQIVSKGYDVDGKFYCSDHVNQALPACYNCGEAIQGTYVVVSHHRHPVCKSCRDGLPRCFLCTMPADSQRGGGQLSDGRHICSEHRNDGVTDQKQASRIFRQARGEVLEVLGRGMKLTQPVKAVRLVGLDKLKTVAQGSGHRQGLSSGKVLGITTITYIIQGSERSLEPSTIHLLNFVPANRMVAVAAHEYAHAWQAEKHRDYSKTDAVMREGFAEWVAFKVAEHYRRQGQMELMKNPAGGVYYQGLLKFLELERRRGVDGVLEFALKATTI